MTSTRWLSTMALRVTTPSCTTAQMTSSYIAGITPTHPLLSWTTIAVALGGGGTTDDEHTMAQHDGTTGNDTKLHHSSNDVIIHRQDSPHAPATQLDDNRRCARGGTAEDEHTMAQHDGSTGNDTKLHHSSNDVIIQCQDSPCTPATQLDDNRG